MYVCVIVLCDRLKPQVWMSMSLQSLNLSAVHGKTWSKSRRPTNKEVPSMWKDMDFEHLVSPTDKNTLVDSTD